MDKWYRGSTPYLRCDVYDDDGALVDPAAVTLSLYDSFGKVRVDDSAMTGTGTTGEFYYVSYTLPADAPSGVWPWIPKSTDGAIKIRNTMFFFEVPEGFA